MRQVLSFKIICEKSMRGQIRSFKEQKNSVRDSKKSSKINKNLMSN